MSCGAVDLIPLGTRERYVCATADLSQMLGVHCTRNYLHIGGMTKYPRGSNSRFADTVFFRNFSELGVQFGKLFVVDKRALEKSILKRLPRLDRHIFNSGILEHTSVVHHRIGIFHISIHSRGDHSRFGDRELKLVDSERMLDCGFQ